jgi:hypothetical protein
MAAAHSCLSPFNAVDMDDIASSFQLGLSARPFNLAFAAGHTNSVGASETFEPSSVAYFFEAPSQHG